MKKKAKRMRSLMRLATTMGHADDEEKDKGRKKQAEKK